ncbi:MAG: histidinol-phosphate transaminase [Candidatus Euphemobacter frigidus]|nr:histidinol-phosphate transaminase [Candidatus Euphemobacter frigidus]MDP8275134.1 histidinol-phosphate transaminase [Candidatus Euphemobacter frigidus]
MSWFRDNIEELEPYVPGFQPKESGFIKLNTNENPYPPSPRVMQVIREISPDSPRLYPDPRSDRLRDKIASTYGFQRENVIVGNGSDELLAIALRCFAGEGDRVVFPAPSYSLFEVLTRIQGAEVVEIPLNNDFSLPEAFFSARGVIKLLASPNSPTGTVYPKETVRRLTEESEGIVVADEAYVDFADDNCLSLVKEYPNLLVTRTFSKSFGLAGLRIGYAFAQGNIIAGMMKVKDSYNLNALSADAAMAALEDMSYFREKVALIKSERASLKKELEALEFFVLPSGANFLFCRPPEGTAEVIYRALLDRKILIRYFDTPRLRDYLRISIGAREEMVTLINSLKEIIK